MARIASGVMAAAAILSMQCDAGVIDPLPPPPEECVNVADPFDRVNAFGLFGYPLDDGPPPAEITFTRHGEFGLGVAAVRLAGGTVISVEDRTTTGPGGFSSFRVTFALQNVVSPATIEMDFTCGNAMATRRFQASYATPVHTRDIITVQAL
jgi:hypothetical protein